MTIEIKHYDESYLDAQVELVREVTRDWKYFNYPNTEQLKQTYAVENFTPHTRYYAFEGENLVGFLSSAFGNQEGTADLQFPFVKSGYEYIQKILMDNAVQTFKEAGVGEVTCNLQSYWDGAKEVVTSFNFEKDTIAAVQMITSVASFDFSDFETAIRYQEIDLESDKNELIRVFQTEMTQTAEQIGEIIEGWKNNQNIVLNTISKDNTGRIVTHSMVTNNPNNSDLVYMTHISIYDEKYKDRRNDQLKYMFQLLKNRGYKTIQLVGIPLDELETYNTDYSSINKTIRYKKQLVPLQSV